MPRHALDPARKKRTVSLTLTPEECQIMHWLSQETGKTPSAIAAELFEREARRISKQKNKPLPDPERDRLQSTISTTQSTAQMIRAGFQKKK